jgi:anthranilate 3-monooxygenase (FAD)/4-hydroxyphenylacetate 3-monooxygenase
MSARTGEQYVEGLRRHPREVWLKGRRIDDVTEEPSFHASIRQLAGLYDLQHDPAHADDLTYASPSTGDAVPTAFLMPRRAEDLRKRGRAFGAAAEATLGMIGRSPDFLNTTVMALAESCEHFARAGERFRDNVVAYYEHVRENDLFLTHALITPQIDRSRSSSEQADALLHLGVVDETPDGLVVHGARMLATLAPVADEVLIYNLPGLRPGDEAHAMVFALPIDAPGIKLICREPYDDGESLDFDRPLSGSLEESDALVVFENVLVPWERVFLHNDVALANSLYQHTSLIPHITHQTNVRGLVKMEFAVGVAMALAEAIKADAHLHVQHMLGECVGYVELIRSALLRAEVDYERSPDGRVRANTAPLQTLRGFLPRVYPRVIEVLQTIGAGGLMLTPSAADFESPIGDDVRRYFQGAEGLAAEDRTRLYKVGWDLAMSPFGTRQVQYERYYAGDPVRLLARNYLTFDKTECEALVQRALRLAGTPGEAPTVAT